MYGRNSFELLKAEVLCRSVGIHWNNNGYFNHPLWELIFSILGNSGRSPGAHWRTSYLDKADIPCPRTCPGEDDAFIYRRPVCSMELKRICFGKR